MHGIGECQFKGYADKWEMCSVVGHTKSKLKQVTNELHAEYHRKVSKNVTDGHEKSDEKMKRVMKTLQKLPKSSKAMFLY